MRAPLDREQVVLFTALHRIEGDLHLPAASRISDRLNTARDFLPITSARVYAHDGRLLYETDVVMVNKAHLVMLLERHATV